MAKKKAGFTLLEIAFTLFLLGLLIFLLSLLFAPLLRSALSVSESSLSSDLFLGLAELGREVRAAKELTVQGDVLYVERGNGDSLRFYRDAQGRLVRQLRAHGESTYRGQLYLMRDLQELRFSLQEGGFVFGEGKIKVGKAGDKPFTFLFRSRLLSSP